VCIGSIEVKRYPLRNLRHAAARGFDGGETGAGLVFLPSPLPRAMRQIPRAAFNEMR
jgi:hypothetical protein